MRGVDYKSCDGRGIELLNYPSLEFQGVDKMKTPKALNEFCEIEKYELNVNELKLSVLTNLLIKRTRQHFQ